MGLRLVGPQDRPPGPASRLLPDRLGCLGVRLGLDAVFKHEFMEVRLAVPKIPVPKVKSRK